MAEAFLASLSDVSPGILDKEDQRCSICLEKYGTAPTGSGIPERAIRLPCNHIMGSECISTWVSPFAQGGSTNNTCPVCRHVLFPVQAQRQQPLSEHQRTLWRSCRDICLRIHKINAIPLATDLAIRFHERVSLDFSSDVTIRTLAAASVFMACRFLGDERPLERVLPRVDGVGYPAVRDSYLLLREEVINPNAHHLY